MSQPGTNWCCTKRIADAPKHLTCRRHAERQCPLVGGGCQHAHGPRLPEEHASCGGSLGSRRRDRAAVAADHEVDAVVVELIDGAGRGFGGVDVDGSDAERPAVDPPVLVHEVGGEQCATVLVDPALTLRPGQGIDGADDDRAGRVSSDPGSTDPARRARHRQKGGTSDRGEGRAQTGHRSTVIRVLAAAWVAAGTPHVPVAQRCHEKSSPAPRSTGNTAAP